MTSSPPNAITSKVKTAVVSGFAALLLSAGSSSAATNILANPGFESGTLTPWFQDSDQGGSVNWGVTNAEAHSGTYSAFDSGNKSIRQNFAPILTDEIVSISFWIKHPNLIGAPLAFDFFYSDGSSPEFVTNTLGLDWEHIDVTSYLEPGKVLNGLSIFGYIRRPTTPTFTYLDDVTISSVPEPASWAMMILGFMAVGAAMRTKRSWLAPQPTARREPL